MRFLTGLLLATLLGGLTSPAGATDEDISGWRTPAG